MRMSLPSRGYGFMLASLAVLAGALFALVLPSGARAAEACPNEQLRQESNLNPTTGVRYSAELPDCRAFEMVSPVEKEQGNIAFGYGTNEDAYQPSTDGDEFLYTSTGPLPGSPSGPLYSQYVALRGTAGWSTVPIDAAQLLVEQESSSVDEFQNFSPTLSCGFHETLEDVAELPAGESVGEVKNLYVWDAATGSSRLVTNTDPLNRPPSTSFHIDEVNADCSRVVFATEYQFLAGAPSGKLSLYEWDEGTLSLVSKLPDGQIASVTRTNESSTTAIGTVSWEGPLIAFSAISDTTTGGPGEIDSGKEEVFVREGGSKTTEASKSQTSTPDSGATYQMGFGEGPPEGFQVLFTANHGITTSSSSAGTDLYDYNVTAKTLTDLSADTNVSDTEGAHVFGVFRAGAGADGSYVYFTASGQLVPGKGNTQAVNNSAKEANIYVAHAGQVEYIAAIPQGTLETGNKAGQKQNFITGQFFDQDGVRVTSSGVYLLFKDEGNQIATTTDNGYNNDTASGEPQAEFYLYSAQTKSTVCVSCNPSGARPVGSLVVPGNGAISNGYLPHILSENGERVIFTSEDKLTSRAVAVGSSKNTYEWEREGVDGSCPSLEHPATSGGCVLLLAPGSTLLDVSPNGDDVFVGTAVPLVAQDVDGLRDIYDIRIDGGFPAPVSAECAGEECQGALNEALTFVSPASAGAPKVGNAAAQPEIKAVKEAKPKALTRAQRLAAALKVCRKKPKRKRGACESQARGKYQAKAKSKSKKKRSKSHGSKSKGSK